MVAEARYGALKARWGSRRLNQLAEATNRVRILPVDPAATVAEPRNRCRSIGLAHHQRGHNADPWIAATAIR